VLNRLGAARSAWNAADIRGEAERLVAAAGVVAHALARRELVEDITARTHTRCVPLLERDDVPEHVRALTSADVLIVEADLTHRLISRAGDVEEPATRTKIGPTVAGQSLDPDQQRAAAALASNSKLVVIEGAAGTGKTTTLAAARTLLEIQHHRLVVVTPTLKAAQVASEQLGTDAFSAAWLIHHHGFRWDDDGHHTRTHLTRAQITPVARLLPGDLLLVDEAGMLDQDTAHALLTLADEQHLRVAFLGDRHQLPAVGRGGVLDLATRWAHPHQHLTLDAVHRFHDPTYADLTLHMRTGHDPGHVFDQLHARGSIAVHATDAELTDALAARGADGELVIAGTREQVALLNAAVRDDRTADRDDVQHESTLITAAGDVIGVGDLVATRRNDRDLDVANRDRWTVTHIHGDGAISLAGSADRPGGSQSRTLPAEFARGHVELAYATTVHGAQGETTDTAHFVLGDTTGAAATYVAMTRGRNHNTAHLVADTLVDARAQWVTAFSRDRADLGPAHAARVAEDDIGRYGPAAPDWRERSASRVAPPRPRPQQEGVEERRRNPHVIGR
jgi:ATP-dependent exoDNAse (exonuclease V) alpha subunit